MEKYWVNMNIPMEVWEVFMSATFEQLQAMKCHEKELLARVHSDVDKGMCRSVIMADYDRLDAIRNEIERINHARKFLEDSANTARKKEKPLG